MTNHPNRSKGYKRHAMGKFGQTLCGLDVHRDTETETELPLAQFPVGITCATCLTKYYGDIRK